MGSTTDEFMMLICKSPFPSYHAGVREKFGSLQLQKQRNKIRAIKLPELMSGVVEPGVDVN